MDDGTLKPSFARRLSLLYAAFFVAAGISQPFFPVWLKAKGLDATGIGIALAMPQLLRIVAIPMVTRAADRHDALREAIVATTGLAVVGYVLVGLSEGTLLILAAFALASLATTPVMPLSETYAFKGLAAHGRAYGPVRLWGSLTYIFGNFLAGFAINVIAARHLIWLIAAASVLNVLAALWLPHLATAAPSAQMRHSAPKPLLRDAAFIAVLAAASLIQASHAVYYGFSTLEWRGIGLDGTVIAALWGIGVLAEIVLFAVSGRLPAFCQPMVLVMIGAAGAALRWGAMALDPPTLALPFLQLLHALSFAATHIGTLTYLSRSAPPGQSATAQGYLAIALGAVMAGAMGLSGVLYAAFGARAYLAMALAAVVGGGCALVAQRVRGHAVQ